LDLVPILRWAIISVQARRSNERARLKARAHCVIFVIAL
jgi:hypothetical protein